MFVCLFFFWTVAWDVYEQIFTREFKSLISLFIYFFDVDGRIFIR